MTVKADDKIRFAGPLPPAVIDTGSTTDSLLSMMLAIQETADTRKLADTGGRQMDSYHYDVTQFCSYIREHGYSLVEGLEAWIREQKQSCRARTVNRKLAAVRARILGSRGDDGVIDILGDAIPASERARIESTLRKIRGVKVASNAVRGAKIMSYTEDIPTLIDSITEPAVRLVVEAMVHTGCRISEVLGIELRNCEPNATKVHVWVVGKGSKERETWLPRELYDRINEHCGGQRYLFEHNWHGERRQYNSRSMTGRISCWCEKVLGRQLSAHAFRHSYATYKLRDQGKDVKIVSRLLGHKSVSTTLDIYDGYILSAEDSAVTLGVDS